jgi:hypothetical protein
MLDRAIDGLKSDEARTLREFSDPTSLLLVAGLQRSGTSR